MNNQLEADGIELYFGERKILSDIYLKCETNLITGLLGRNGHGKTSLMNIIYGTLSAKSRSVRLNGLPLFEAYKRPDLINYLPQFNFVPPQLNLSRIFKDFELPMTDFEDFFPEFSGFAAQALGRFSGGQRRLIEVYLVIKSNSQFSLLDEPFSQLMPLHIEQIQILLAEAKKTKGFLITDHFYHSVMEVSNTLYVLKDGKTHLTTCPEDLMRLGYTVT